MARANTDLLCAGMVRRDSMAARVGGQTLRQTKLASGSAAVRAMPTAKGNDSTKM